MTKRKRVAADVFDLEERTSKFGKAMILFCKKVPESTVNAVIVTQWVRSGTSVGANYGEANDAESRKDFRHKIGIFRKESKETMHWIQMIFASEPQLRDPAKPIWKEAKELNLIFGKIRRSSE